MMKRWTIELTRKAQKQAGELNPTAYASLRLLIGDLIVSGPYANRWPNYGKLYGKRAVDKLIATLKREDQLMFVVGK